MSLHSLCMYVFDEAHLNRLHVETIKRLEAKDLACYSCGAPFELGQKILSKKYKTTGAIGVKRRHVSCALRIGLITRAELKQLENMKNLIFVGLMAGWVCVMAQWHVLANG